MPEKILTIKDVSQKAGVHPSTVSLCLNNSPKVAKKTRARIQKIARAMGYRPHPHLKALMRSRRQGGGGTGTPTVGFVTFFPTRLGWKKRIPTLQKTIDGARQKAESRGFHLEELWMPQDRFLGEKVLHLLQAKGISGVLLSALPTTMESLDWPWEHLAVVAIGPSLRDPKLHRIRSNHFKSMTMAMHECHRLGYRRLGLALRDEVNRRMDYRWMAAYLATRDDLKLQNSPEPLSKENWSREVFLQWIKTEKPDVVFVTRTEEPIEWLQSAGYSIPDDIGMVTLSTPSLGSKQTGIYEHWRHQGERGMMMLIDLLTDNEFGRQDSPIISVVDGSWNPGTTVRTV